MPNTTVVVSGNVVKKGVGKSRIAKAEKIVPAPAQLDEFATLPLVEKADSRKKKRRRNSLKTRTSRRKKTPS